MIRISRDFYMSLRHTHPDRATIEVIVALDTLERRRFIADELAVFTKKHSIMLQTFKVASFLLVWSDGLLGRMERGFWSCHVFCGEVTGVFRKRRSQGNRRGEIATFTTHWVKGWRLRALLLVGQINQQFTGCRGC